VGLGLGLALVLALSGCAFSDPRIDAPVPTPSTDPGLAAQVEQAADQVFQAWQAVAGLTGRDPQSQYHTMADTLESQWLVLVGPDPLHRVPATGTTIGPPPPAATADDAAGQADLALADTRDQHQARAEATTGLAAVFWAALAAATEQIRLGLTGMYDEPPLPEVTTTVMLTTEDGAWTDLVGRYDAGIFALTAAQGFFEAADPQRSMIATTVAGLRRDRADLADLADQLGLVAPTPAGIYDLPEGRDAQAGLDWLALTQASLVQASAVWVGSAEDPSLALPFLMSNATWGLRFGLGTAIWPGWPDA
jgi:hypothetical protein